MRFGRMTELSFGHTRRGTLHAASATVALGLVSGMATGNPVHSNEDGRNLARQNQVLTTTDQHVLRRADQRSGLPSLARAKIIAGGGQGWAIVIQPDNTLRGWGQNLNNVLDIPEDLTDGSRRVVAVDSWGGHVMALTEDGTAYAWGLNSYGQCNIPAELGPCHDVSGGDMHSVAIRRADGKVFAWGRPDYNATQVPAGLTAVEIHAGNVHQLYLREDNTIGGFGMNYNGQCNIPDGVQPPIDFDASESWSMGLSITGQPDVWGFNTGTYPPIDGCNYCIPSEAADAIDMATGHYWAMVLTADGSIVTWGDNDNQQCEPPSDMAEVIMIHANGDTGFAIHPDGSVTGWGNGAGADVPEDVRVWLLDEPFNDCNENGVSDYEDIASGTSEDLNGNFTPDECECLADVAGVGACGHRDASDGRWGASYAGSGVPTGASLAELAMDASRRGAVLR